MVNINGVSFSGNNIVVKNNVVYIDGQKIDTPNDVKVINISVDADVNALTVDNCSNLLIKGNCGSVSSTNGDVDINGDVSGDVTNKNGNITCGSISGSVTNKNGNIKHR